MVAINTADAKRCLRAFLKVSKSDEKSRYAPHWAHQASTSLKKAGLDPASDKSWQEIGLKDGFDNIRSMAIKGHSSHVVASALVKLAKNVSYDPDNPHQTYMAELYRKEMIKRAKKLMAANCPEKTDFNQKPSMPGKVAPNP